jgi:hypothetical protein
VPLKFKSKDGAQLAEIAQVLLDEKVLQSSDWTGTLEGSVQAGLFRWTGRDMQATRWRCLDLELELMTECDHNVNPNYWAQRTRTDDRAPGGFALRVGSWTPVNLQGPCERLAVLAPGSEQCLAWAVCTAVHAVFRGGAPRWALDQHLEWREGEFETDWDYMSPEETAEAQAEGRVREAEEFDGDAIRVEFLHGLPRYLIDPKWDARAYKAARAAPGTGLLVGELIESMGDLRTTVLALERAQPKIGDPNDAVHALEAHPILPLRVCWNDEDTICQLWDEWHDMTMQDEYTETPFLRLFSLIAPRTATASLPAALCALEKVFAVLAEMDTVVSLINQINEQIESHAANRERVRV